MVCRGEPLGGIYVIGAALKDGTYHKRVTRGLIPCEDTLKKAAITKHPICQHLDLGLP